MFTIDAPNRPPLRADSVPLACKPPRRKEHLPSLSQSGRDAPGEFSSFFKRFPNRLVADGSHNADLNQPVDPQMQAPPTPSLRRFRAMRSRSPQPNVLRFLLSVEFLFVDAVRSFSLASLRPHSENRSWIGTIKTLSKNGRAVPDASPYTRSPSTSLHFSLLHCNYGYYLHPL